MVNTAEFAFVFSSNFQPILDGEYIFVIVSALLQKFLSLTKNDFICRKKSFFS